MGILLDVAEPGSQPPPNSGGADTDGSRLRTIAISCAAIAVLAVGSQVLLIEPPANSPARLEPVTSSTVIDPSTNAFSDSPLLGTVPDQLQVADTGEFLVLISSNLDRDSGAFGPLLLKTIEISTGRISIVVAPEALINSEPIVVSSADESGQAGIAVVGRTAAWFGQMSSSEFTWTHLGPADEIRASTQAGRLWLKTGAGSPSDPNAPPSDAQFLWTEVDVTGRFVRALYRDNELALPSPELAVGRGSGIFRLATESELIELGLPDDENHWRPLSIRGTVVAVGPNDLVASECATFLECNRVWYDPRTGEQRGGLYDDLADGLNPRFAALMSPDGRFVASEADNTETRIVSVATLREVANRCIWGESLAWSAGSEMLACNTAAGIEMYDLATGDSLGLATDRGGRWAIFVDPDSGDS